MASSTTARSTTARSTTARSASSRATHAALLLLAGAALGCSSEPTGAQPPTGSGGEPPAGDAALELTVEPDRRTFVELATPSVLSDIEGDGANSLAWDLALQGRDVFTNGGISGPGNSSAFGPLSAPTFLSDTAPEVPLLLKDRAGGALLDWYDYGGPAHQLWSRYHVYGLRDGDRLFKLQILSYYGEVQGAPVSALYRIRFAELLDSGASETQELEGIDATAGGTQTSDGEPSACLDLTDQSVSMLTPAQAAKSMAWQLCFRRESIAVNGGLSGPRGVEAVDLQAADTATEAEADIQKRTAASEQALFDDVDYAALSAGTVDWRSDGVATAFAQRWLEPGTSPPALSDSVWLVMAADGAGKYLVKFADLSGELGDSSASLSLRAKSVR